MDFLRADSGKGGDLRPRYPQGQRGHPPPRRLPARGGAPVREPERPRLFALFRQSARRQRLARGRRNWPHAWTAPWTGRSHSLSLGNKRKIGLIQAFMHKPELLILDEPTSGLDPIVRHEILPDDRGSQGAGADRLFFLAQPARSGTGLRPRGHHPPGTDRGHRKDRGPQGQVGAQPGDPFQRRHRSASLRRHPRPGDRGLATSGRCKGG